MTEIQCKIESCQREHYARGWCQLHYQRFWKNGDPGTLELMKKENGKGTIDKRGYRILKINGQNHLEHRLVMERYLGRNLLDTESVHHKMETAPITELKILNYGQLPSHMDKESKIN